MRTLAEHDSNFRLIEHLRIYPKPKPHSRFVLVCYQHECIATSQLDPFESILDQLKLHPLADCIVDSICSSGVLMTNRSCDPFLDFHLRLGTSFTLALPVDAEVKLSDKEKAELDAFCDDQDDSSADGDDDGGLASGEEVGIHHSATVIIVNAHGLSVAHRVWHF